MKTLLPLRAPGLPLAMQRPACVSGSPVAGRGLTPAGLAAAARVLLSAGVLSGLMWVALPAAASEAREDAAFARAMADHEKGHWAQAWAVLAPLADAGHRQAARQALHMAQHGPGGVVHEIGPGRLARWETVASGGAREPVPQPGPHGC